MERLRICFGAYTPESASEGTRCVTVPPMTSPDEAYRIMDAQLKNGCSADRVTVMADAEGLNSALAFTAAYEDRIAGVWIRDVSDDFRAETAASVRRVPIRVSGTSSAAKKLVRVLRTYGNADAELTAHEEDAWLDSLSIDARLSPTMLQPGLYDIQASRIDSFFLVTGRERALLIDTGMGSTPIRPLIEALTPLPVTVVLTHVHYDHILHIDEFDAPYMSEADFPLIDEFCGRMLPEKGYTVDHFRPLSDGTVFDLGGVKVEALACPGHTPGSMCFVDHTHKAIFTGDAIGSGMGVLMAISGAMCISEYLASLRVFRERIRPYEDYAMYGGHRVQEHLADRTKHDINPLSPELVDDMITLCERLLAKEPVKTVEQPHSSSDEESVLYVSFGRADMWVYPSQIH